MLSQQGRDGRYEYDAYGNCSILEPNFAPDPDGKSDYGNPYLFTGRRVDILDNGSLKIQYNRNRYYDYYTGRWLTHDPLGITPNPQRPNRFDAIGQYGDGLNLYESFSSQPLINVDPLGLLPVERPEDMRRRGILPILPPRSYSRTEYVRKYTKAVWDKKKNCIKAFHVYGHGFSRTLGRLPWGTRSIIPIIRPPKDAIQVIGFDTVFTPLFNVSDLPNGNFCCNAMIKLWGCAVGNNKYYMSRLARDAERYNPCKKIRIVACTGMIVTLRVPGVPELRLRRGICHNGYWITYTVRAQD
ncbi:MAG: RHS repeat-associated core domain-containing protein [Planctomycetota bacterium]